MANLQDDQNRLTGEMSHLAPLTSLSDEQLAEQAQEGCLASFGELVRRYQVPVFHFLQRKCRSVSDAEDLTQETFLRAFRKLSHYRVDSPFRPWIFTVAYRIALNSMRGRRYSTVGENENNFPVAEVDCQLERSEERLQLWDAVQAELTPVQFTAVWLFYVEEFNVREIARVIRKSESAVKTMLCRARKLLVHRLRGYAEDKGITVAKHTVASSKTA